MATIELSIDLGSKFITIYQKGIGLVLREPAIAIATKARNRLEIRDAGYRAESVMTGALGGAKVIAPIKEGIIVDEEMATMLLAYFLKRLCPRACSLRELRQSCQYASPRPVPIDVPLRNAV